MKIIKLSIVFLFLLGCTSEADRHEYNVSIRNESGTLLEIRGFDTNNNIVFEDQLNNLEKTQECSYLSESYGGLTCKIDSIAFVFSNAKGYICHLRIGSDASLCFPEEKTPFGDSDFFIEVGNNRYEFIITEEDFINAHDLPE